MLVGRLVTGDKCGECKVDWNLEVLTKMKLHGIMFENGIPPSVLLYFL